jgi:serine/threonine protein phosphatase PrpC
MVADGMGGHHDGEKASALTVRAVASHVTKNIYLPLLNRDGMPNQGEMTDVLVEAVQEANSEVIDKVPDGGTTVSAVAVVGDIAHIVHVGDSRIYLITKEGVEQITRDHSIVQRYIELDHITREEAADHPQKNVLYRAIGQSEALEVDTLTRRLLPSTRLLLCSDGLWGQVHEKEIFEIVMNAANPQEACDKLVALANTRGGIDNITTILLKVPSS